MGSFMVLSFSATLRAAGWFVRQGASGRADGSDWTNAFPVLPGNLKRGDTYWIASGSYPGVTLNTPNSGSLVITLKKATLGEHGTEAGWSIAYGDGPAVFSGDISIHSDYWTIDGGGRDEGDWAMGDAYGFRIPGFRASTEDSGGNCASNLTVKFVNAGGTPVGNPPTGGVDQAFYVGGFAEHCQDWLLSKNFVHDTITTFHLNGARDITVEYTYIVNGYSKESIRGQIWMSGLVVRHNIFKDSCQGNPADPTAGACTATIGLFDGYLNSSAWANAKIYGNVFFVTNNASMQDAIILVGGTNDNVPGVEIYNNTLAGFQQGNRSVLVRGVTSVCRNNVGYDIAGGLGWSCNTLSNNVNPAANPFADYGEGDFRLTAPLSVGYTLPAPYNVDLLGNARGEDGNWDVGAYEFSGAPTPPAPPKGLTLSP